MKKTNNPDVPTKDEVTSFGKHSATLKRGSLNDSVIQPTPKSFDFMNYPEAIPEEVFVYFSS